MTADYRAEGDDMTNDGTNVDLEEMNALSGAVFGFAGEVKSVGDRAGGIDYNVNAFGLLGSLCARSASNAAERAVAGLNSLYLNVHADATAISETALDFKNNEQVQTDRFRSDDHG
jgi:hypothetical protein